MAEVLSPMLSQNSTATMHQRQTPSPDAYQPAIPNGQSQQQSRTGQRTQYSSHIGGAGYRGASAAPVAPYAFKSTPHLRQENHRTTSAPNHPSAQASESSSASSRQQYPAQASVSTTSSTSSNPSSFGQQLFAKDDSVLFSNFHVAPFTTQQDSVTDIHVVPDENSHARHESPSKPSPDRYRRGVRRTDSNGPPSPQQPLLDSTSAANSYGSGKVGQMYNPQQISIVSQKPMVALASRPAYDLPDDVEERERTDSPMSVADKGPLQSPVTDLPKRYRRRTSSGNMGETVTPSASDSKVGSVTPAAGDIYRSSESVGQQTPAQLPSTTKEDPRNPSAADVVRRANNSSPLSRSVTPSEPSGLQGGALNSSFRPTSSQGSIISQSPAVAAMAALNEREPPKGTKSRLRRAFSFGSSAELRRASGDMDSAADRARARRQQQFSNDLDEEQDAVAQRQEAAGLGRGIYSGQFTGSTDNLSISSTASSASMMLRKMGQGMRKSGRSLKGLFRPKSVVGVPAADASIRPSIGPVSMINVEAEREQVNVNLNPHDYPGGGTGYPKLELNSLDVGRISSPSGPDSRRSIADQDRNEVTTAAKRGILKRSATAPHVPTPLAIPANAYSYDPYSPAFPSPIQRHGSPAPSTSSSEPRRSGHRRTDSVTVDTDDYFASVPRVGGQQTSRSLPGTPRGLARNISFSPRIHFHEVWSSTEYDRRGEIATCNRLTPTLAQQIKEELNTFKMEMEVHELSKTHTHFF